MEWQRAYVLHLRHYGASKYWVDLITQSSGRVQLLWRKGKKTSELIPFTPYAVNWQQKGDIKLLTGWEIDGAPVDLKGNALFCGFYINELCERLLSTDEESLIPFSAYELAILGLAEVNQLEKTLRGFEWQLICHLGFEFSFTHVGFEGEPIAENKRYSFNPRAGFELLWNNSAAEGILGGDILSLGRGEWNDELSRVAKAIFRKAIQSRLGSKPLKSRDYFR